LKYSDAWLVEKVILQYIVDYFVCVFAVAEDCGLSLQDHKSYKVLIYVTNKLFFCRYTYIRLTLFTNLNHFWGNCTLLSDYEEFP